MYSYIYIYTFAAYLARHRRRIHAVFQPLSGLVGRRAHQDPKEIGKRTEKMSNYL